MEETPDPNSINIQSEQPNLGTVADRGHNATVLASLIANQAAAGQDLEVIKGHSANILADAVEKVSSNTSTLPTIPSPEKGIPEVPSKKSGG